MRTSGFGILDTFLILIPCMCYVCSSFIIDWLLICKDMRNLIQPFQD